MLRSELIARSPIRILEQSIHGGLAHGEMGAFTARKGVGKTACLVHVAVEKLLRDQRVLHLSFADNPQHIETWYQQVFRQVARAYQMEKALENNEPMRNRLILHFRQADVDLQHIGKTVDQFSAGASFKPDVVIVDGYSFYDHTREDFEGWKQFAVAHDTALWFSATLHREALAVDEEGIPAPVNSFKELFSVIIMLQPEQGYIGLKLLKDRDSTRLDALKLKLDPETLLIANRRI